MRKYLILLHFCYFGFPGGAEIGWLCWKIPQSQPLCYPQEKEMTGDMGDEINLHSLTSTSLVFSLGLSPTDRRASCLLQDGCPKSAALGYKSERVYTMEGFVFITINDNDKNPTPFYWLASPCAISAIKSEHE